MVLVEWAVLCSLLREENGTISKNRLRRVYDVSSFLQSFVLEDPGFIALLLNHLSVYTS